MRDITVNTLGSAAPLIAQPNLAESIDRVVARYHEAGLFNGVVLVADAGRVIYSKGFGYSNFEWKVPNTPATRFRIGSVTKPFTAVLVLQQVDQRKDQARRADLNLSA